MRIALIHISQETNDFNPQLTTLADFRAFGLYEGEEIVRLGTIGKIGGHFPSRVRSRAKLVVEPTENEMSALCLFEKKRNEHRDFAICPQTTDTSGDHRCRDGLTGPEPLGNFEKIVRPALDEERIEMAFRDEPADDLHLELERTAEAVHRRFSE